MKPEPGRRGPPNGGCAPKVYGESSPLPLRSGNVRGKIGPNTPWELASPAGFWRLTGVRKKADGFCAWAQRITTRPKNFARSLVFDRRKTPRGPNYCRCPSGLVDHALETVVQLPECRAIGHRG